MELKIIEEKGNPLFNRRESQLRVQAKITPSRAEVAKSVSEKFSTPIENIEIKKIAGKFGSNFFNINVFIYDSKEDRMSTEKKPKLIIEQKTEEKSEEKSDESDKTQETEEEKTEEKKVGSQQSETTNTDEGNNKINENVDNESPNKENSERNESEANQNKEKIGESAKS